MKPDEKESLELFRSYLESTLCPTYILSYMKPWLAEQDIAELAAIEEKKGPTTASSLFLERLLKSEAEGVFRGFLDGLRNAGYTGLCDAFENRDFQKIESLDKYRMLLKTLEPSIKNNIKPSEMIPHLKNCLLTRECEEIIQIAENRGPIAGSEKLIACLLRSDKEAWPKTFHLALESENCACTYLWEIRGESEEEPSKITADEQEENSLINIAFHYEEKSEKANLCSALGTTVFTNSVTFSPETAGISEDLAFHKVLRRYQIELAQSAFEGKNAIICSPTGSGKTVVALAICEHHFNSMPEGKKGKVVFLATKVPVYEQQKDIFKKHFESRRYTVTGISGETSESIPVGAVVSESDIIVLTPQILVNNLKNGSVSSLSMFSMLIFDECHNTTKNHPYNVLMCNYLDMKLSSTAAELPQIIGLTASVGVGKSRTIKETQDYICKLCASLDAQVISTVRENVEDLEKYVCKPQKLIREVGNRQKDPFTDIISNMMAETETLARKAYPLLETLSNIQNRSFGTQKYEQWIVDTQKKCRVLQMENKEEESLLCRTLFTYTEHLRKYNDALMINDDARTKDALAYLKEFFTNVRSGGFDIIEQHLTKNFEDKQQELYEISNDESNENPKLDDLSFILDEEYHMNPQTRTLLFVKTRALTIALKNWIEESSQLSFLKPDVLIGRGKRDQSTGMTLPSQKGVLDSFKSKGESKMLIATSVADEGIDIADCNLVLLYEYIGNVIKMIQVRGRGRAKDSKCILVTSKPDQAEKEKINIFQERMMNEAIEALQCMSKEEFVKQIHILQIEEKAARDCKKNAIQPKREDSKKRLLCSKCKAFACYSDDIRVIQESHHAVLNESFATRFLTKPHKKQKCFQGFQKKIKIFCKNPVCCHDWGISGSYLTFQDIPVIKICSFVVEDIETGAQDYFSRWVDVNFTMKDFDKAEMSKKAEANSH
ncbi:LOW QUALITY PROTEIN: probable ATP-dependent RNA helicase DDX58 [Rhinatrema bivittatum]|uniref:LOW QUALITY PROTEIN: probable ATP-dependent RNA helicase DDX58 n=1 Tax=Rhinatrema bivittatum TaxID=194408 RepID=UPI00112BC385|nr:LOW QUALITY PROTEIN: probable ATP-dependent RNA helicase DDX58 [Rhinatrema bivittatum]